MKLTVSLKKFKSHSFLLVQKLMKQKIKKVHKKAFFLTLFMKKPTPNYYKCKTYLNFSKTNSEEEDMMDIDDDNLRKTHWAGKVFHNI